MPVIRYECVSAALSLEVPRANLPSLHEPGRPTEQTWAAVDGAVGRRPAPAGSVSGLAGSVCGPGKTARRCSSNWSPGCVPASWPACPSSALLPP